MAVMRSADWPFHLFTAGFGPHGWGWRWPDAEPSSGPHGDALRIEILRVLKDRPRTRPEILEALERRLGAAASAATIYPTLQLLEDLGHVRVEESEGKRVYSITAAGEAFLGERREPGDDAFEWLRGAGGTLAELGQVVARLASVAYRQACRSETAVKRVIEILRRAADEIDRLS
jgi:DNA-binding PadR family transcriptional regulator